MKLLLAVDSLLSSETLIKWLAIHPWGTYTTICVINVVESDLVEPSAVSPEYLTEIHIDAAKALVNAVSKKLALQNCTIMTAVPRGRAQAAIIDYAEDWEADFIIMGSHGHNRLERFLLGSTTKSVVRGAPCSVEIVRPRISESEEIRILVATDGSEFSKVAIDSVIKRHWPKGSKIKIVSVFNSSIPLIDPIYVYADVIDRINEEGKKYAEECVETAKNLLLSNKMDVEGTILEGEPKSAILDEARSWEADLIVVGSHGRRGISRFLLGSVAEAVALYAHCSVDVIREQFKQSVK